MHPKRAFARLPSLSHAEKGTFFLRWEASRLLSTRSDTLRHGSIPPNQWSSILPGIEDLVDIHPPAGEVIGRWHEEAPFSAIEAQGHGMVRIVRVVGGEFDGVVGLLEIID